MTSSMIKNDKLMRKNVIFKTSSRRKMINFMKKMLNLRHLFLGKNIKLIGNL